jgi:hypothetical protein
MDEAKLKPQHLEGEDASTKCTYQKPEIVLLGNATEITRNSNSGPFTDGSSDDNYRWKAG